MLPPPTTIPTWTPRRWTSATWRAMNAQNAGSTPYGPIAEEGLAGQLQQDPAVANAAGADVADRRPGVAHRSSPRA